MRLAWNLEQSRHQERPRSRRGLIGAHNVGLITWLTYQRPIWRFYSCLVKEGLGRQDREALDGETAGRPVSL